MSKLSGAQRKYLRGVAHSFKPHVYVGKEGLSQSVIDSINTAIEAQELIKIKIVAERDEREEMIPMIEERLECECVGAIGKMAILYREQTDPEKRKISFPG